jgi:hypothetical protein
MRKKLFSLLSKYNMNSPRAQTLIDDYQTNTWLIRRHAEGITDSESLLQPPFPANCLNWVLGHILWRRNSALAALGLEPLWGEEVASLYRSGSPPITSSADARRFADLLDDLQRSQEALSTFLGSASDDDLDNIVANDLGEKRVVEHLQGFHWHETYHIGQLEILRAFIESKRGSG